MEHFPAHFNPANAINFKRVQLEAKARHLRQVIYEAAIRADELPVAIDLQNVQLGTFESSFRVDSDLITMMRTELEVMGWLTNLAYGGSVLYLHSKDVPLPKEAVNCTSFS